MNEGGETGEVNGVETQKEGLCVNREKRGDHTQGQREEKAGNAVRLRNAVSDRIQRTFSSYSCLNFTPPAGRLYSLDHRSNFDSKPQ